MDQAPDIESRPGRAPYRDYPYRDAPNAPGPPGPPGRDGDGDGDRPRPDRPRRAWLAGSHRRGGTDWPQIAIYGGLVIALAALAWLAGPSDGQFIWPLV